MIAVEQARPRERQERILGENLRRQSLSGSGKCLLKFYFRGTSLLLTQSIPSTASEFYIYICNLCYTYLYNL